VVDREHSSLTVQRPPQRLMRAHVPAQDMRVARQRSLRAMRWPPSVTIPE
jgi:hypothetical protein